MLVASVSSKGEDLGCPILQLELLSLIPFTCNWHCSLKGCKQQSQALQADLTARMWHCAHRAAQTKGSRLVSGRGFALMPCNQCSVIFLGGLKAITWAGSMGKLCLFTPTYFLCLRGRWAVSAGCAPSTVQLRVVLSNREILCWVFNSCFWKSWLESNKSVSMGKKKKEAWALVSDLTEALQCRQAPLSDFHKPYSSFLNTDVLPGTGVSYHCVQCEFSSPPDHSCYRGDLASFLCIGHMG